jgi:TRAP-type C4-dicarboxylate transport system permease small subunit
VLRLLISLLARVNAACCWGSAGLIVAMMVSIIYDVGARLFFRAPTIWVIDVNEYALVYITFLPAAWILLRDGHIKVELVYERLRPPARRAVRTVTDLLGLVYCVVLAWQSWLTAWDAWVHGYRFSTALTFPRFPVLVVIPFGAAWLALAFVARLGTRASSSPPAAES